MLALDRIGPEAKALAPILIEIFQATQDHSKAFKYGLVLPSTLLKVRQESISALGQVSTKGTQEHSPIFVQALQDKDAQVRKWGAWGLGRIRPESHEAIKMLLKNLDEPHQEAREKICWAIGHISPDAEGAVGLLFPHFTHKDKMVQETLFQVIKKIQTPDKLSALIRNLKNENVEMRRAATKLIGEMGKKGEKGAVELINAFQDSDSEVRQNAVWALGWIGANASLITPLLMEALEKEAWYVRACAAKSLGKLGPDAKEAVPALKNTLNDSDGNVQLETQQALLNIIGEIPSQETNASESSPFFKIILVLLLLLGGGFIFLIHYKNAQTQKEKH